MTEKTKSKARSSKAEAVPTSTVIRGARMHNLRGVDCEIPLRKITAITGVSGSGKSSLAFDVLYAEGQRRFVECLSAYARQFLERLERPKVEKIGYIQPPIALKQRVNIRNARSTVGSVTELTDHLRLLFVHAGQTHCRKCGARVVRTETADAVGAIQRFPEATRLAIVAPLPVTPAGESARRLLAEGYTRIFTNGKIVEIEELADAVEPSAPGRRRAARKHRAGALRKSEPRRPRGAEGAGVVIDRIVVGKARRGRLAESIQAAWKMGNGVCGIHPLDARSPNARRDEAAATSSLVFRQGMACPECGTPSAPLTVALFSWNSPIGACPECQGFGRIVTIDRNKVVPNPRKNLRNNTVVPFSVPSARSWYRRLLRSARARGIPTDMAFEQLSPAQQDWVFAGDEEFPGVEGFFEHLESKRYKMHVRIFISRFRGYEDCPRCGQSRLRPEALAVTFGGRNIHELHEMPIEELAAFFEVLDPAEAELKGVRRLVEGVRARLGYLQDVGVGYLTLGRAGRTLSGGETQRIRLAAALGSALSDTLYILDEPTVGLHATDSIRMLEVLKRLAVMGNTVVVVEHDPGIIAGADHLIVLGPGGGGQGGRLIYEGPVRPFLKEHPGFFLARAPHGSKASGTRVRRGRRRSLRGIPKRAIRGRKLDNPWDAEAVHQWLRGNEPESAPPQDLRISDRPRGPLLRLVEAREHNLRIERLELPLSRLVVITGVSGSGKSTLVDEVVHRNWLRLKGRPVEDVGRVGYADGFQALDEVHLVGQQMLGRSSRSNPISFVQAYGEIRKLLAGTLSARQRALEAGSFSFNTAGGRCETCKGIGTQTLEMYFLPDIDVPCEACGGKRFRPEVLDITWHNKNIDEILRMTVDEATAFFRSKPAIMERLAPLREVGLGYITLGQSTATLSGGEAQRLRLASFLAKGSVDERHLFLFDEPTTGLHARDVERLLRALRGLLACGHGVIVVEHHLDFIQAADWVVDLGPGPGAAGGRVVYAGTVPGLLSHKTSRTAQALREHMARIHSSSSTFQ